MGDPGKGDSELWNMEPTNHRFGKENDLNHPPPWLHDCVPAVIFRGVTTTQKKGIYGIHIYKKSENIPHGLQKLKFDGSMLMPPKSWRFETCRESWDQPPTSPGISPISMYLCRPIPRDSMYTVCFPTFKVSLGSKMQVQYTIHRAYTATFPTFRLDSGHVALGCCTSIPKPCACFCSCSTTWLGRSLDFRTLKHFKPHRRIATRWPWSLFN